MKVILCPTSEIMTKVVNKFIRIMFNARDKIDEGIDLSQTCYPTYTPPFNFVNSTSFDELASLVLAQCLVKINLKLIFQGWSPNTIV
jgi:hypothetical protein